MVYDVFAGTGSFGIEAMSRGMSTRVFFERHRPALARLRRNLETVGIEQACRLRTGDIYKEDFADLESPSVVFFDSPYAHVHDRQDDVVATIGRLVEKLSPDGILVFRHDAKDNDVAVPTATEVDRRKWGQMTARLMRQS